MSNSRRLTVAHITDDLTISELRASIWEKARDILISKYWSGAGAPATRHFKARLLWSDTALYVRFEAAQSEPLVVSEKADVKMKIRGLWDRDVCEIFIAPDKKKRNKYFEFEIAPNGEWIDLGIEVTPDERVTDWDYKSGMTSFAKIEEGKVVMAIKIPWEAFGVARPKIGDVWLGNLFRCVGKGKTRGYLAWSPTETPKPNFHVPEKFGEFEFVK
ncbi:MAG: carbohydrate-binding family 9-like protein [Pyrinomonadaceae bacterium]